MDIIGILIYCNFLTLFKPRRLECINIICNVFKSIKTHVSQQGEIPLRISQMNHQIIIVVFSLLLIYNFLVDLISIDII